MLYQDRNVHMMVGLVISTLGLFAHGFAVPSTPSIAMKQQHLLPYSSTRSSIENKIIRCGLLLEAPSAEATIVTLAAGSSFVSVPAGSVQGTSKLNAAARLRESSCIKQGRVSSRGPEMSCSAALGVGRAAAGGVGAASAAALLRGGAVVEHNVIAGVLAELANIRTPAALLGGAALGTMFVGPKPGGNRRLHLLYTMLSTSAFTLQLVCVLCSTLTYTAVASKTEAIAVSAISYLSQHMQFEFLVIRGSFVYGLFSFLGALMVRGWLTYSSDGERGSARVMMAILGSSAIFLLNFLHHTHNALTLCLGGMTKRLFWLTMSNMYHGKRRLLRHITAIVSIWVAVKLFKLGPNEGGEVEAAATAPAEAAAAAAAASAAGGGGPAAVKRVK